jgi:hypothetical protein
MCTGQNAFFNGKDNGVHHRAGKYSQGEDYSLYYWSSHCACYGGDCLLSKMLWFYSEHIRIWVFNVSWTEVY